MNVLKTKILNIFLKIEFEEHELYRQYIPLNLVHLKENSC
jgi:hypothetical protein